MPRQIAMGENLQNAIDEVGIDDYVLTPGVHDLTEGRALTIGHPLRIKGMPESVIRISGHHDGIAVLGDLVELNGFTIEIVSPEGGRGIWVNGNNFRGFGLKVFRAISGGATEFQGIHFADGERNLTYDCHIRGAWGTGINIAKGKDPVIIGNVIEDCYRGVDWDKDMVAREVVRGNRLKGCRIPLPGVIRT